MRVVAHGFIWRLREPAQSFERMMTPVPRKVRCAAHTRKSSEEGLDQQFNSLDAQREACEAYIRSQKAEGWLPVRDRYDDGGYSGGNLDRPALKRLLADIGAGKIDVVVVYKIDRLSRSLLDFSKLVGHRQICARLIEPCGHGSNVMIVQILTSLDLLIWYSFCASTYGGTSCGGSYSGVARRSLTYCRFSSNYAR